MKQIVIIAFLLVMSGCQNVQRPEKPKNLISKDKMVDILTESYIATAARGVGTKEMLVKNIKIDSFIYTKYGIDSLQFVQSNDFYASDSNTYIEIFERVERKLTQLDQQLDSIRSQEQKLQDTIVDRRLREEQAQGASAE